MQHYVRFPLHFALCFAWVVLPSRSSLHKKGMTQIGCRRHTRFFHEILQFWPLKLFRQICSKKHLIFHAKFALEAERLERMTMIVVSPFKFHVCANAFCCLVVVLVVQLFVEISLSNRCCSRATPPPPSNSQQNRSYKWLILRTFPPNCFESFQRADDDFRRFKSCATTLSLIIQCSLCAIVLPPAVCNNLILPHSSINLLW